MQSSDIDLGVLANFVDIPGGKIAIKTRNIETIDLVQGILADNPLFKCLDTDSPGLRVRAILPKPAVALLKSNTLIKLILMHYKNLGHQDISFFQPPKEVATDTFLLYLELSYPAQKSFAKHNWSIKLLGTNIRLNKHNAPKGTSPEIKKDNSPLELLESTDNLE